MAQLAGSDDDGHADDRDEAAKVQSQPLAAKPVEHKASHRKPDKGNPASAIDAVSISLRQAYESTLHEEIPDSFLDLLRKLD